MTRHFDIDVDDELRRLCDDLLRVARRRNSTTPELAVRMAAIATRPVRPPGIWSPNGAVSSATPKLALTAPFWHRVAARVGLVLVIGQSDAPGERRHRSAVACHPGGILAGDGPRRSSRRHRGGVGGTAPGRFSWRSSLAAPAQVVAGVSAALAAADASPTTPVRRESAPGTTSPNLSRIQFLTARMSPQSERLLAAARFGLRWPSPRRGASCPVVAQRQAPLTGGCDRLSVRRREVETALIGPLRLPIRPMRGRNAAI